MKRGQIIDERLSFFRNKSAHFPEIGLVENDAGNNVAEALSITLSMDSPPRVLTSASSCLRLVDLPGELVHVVFEFSIQSHSDLRRLQLVCSTFYNLLTHVDSQLYLPDAFWLRIRESVGIELSERGVLKIRRFFADHRDEDQKHKQMWISKETCQFLSEWGFEPSETTGDSKDSRILQNQPHRRYFLPLDSENSEQPWEEIGHRLAPSTRAIYEVVAIQDLEISWLRVDFMASELVNSLTATRLMLSCVILPSVALFVWRCFLVLSEPVGLSHIGLFWLALLWLVGVWGRQMLDVKICSETKSVLGFVDSFLDDQQRSERESPFLPKGSPLTWKQRIESTSWILGMWIAVELYFWKIESLRIWIAAGLLLSLWLLLFVNGLSRAVFLRRDFSMKLVMAISLFLGALPYISILFGSTFVHVLSFSLVLVLPGSIYCSIRIRYFAHFAYRSKSLRFGWNLIAVIVPLWVILILNDWSQRIIGILLLISISSFGIILVLPEKLKSYPQICGSPGLRPQRSILAAIKIYCFWLWRFAWSLREARKRKCRNGV